MTIYKATDENLIRASQELRKGNLVSFPTETVYGLGADAFNEDAVVKIFKAKKRPFFDPLIVHVSDLQMVSLVAKSIPEKAELLIEKFWPGPLTIVLNKKDSLPDIVTSGLDTVAVRMPGHEVALKLIEHTERPVAAPSANPFSFISPTSAEHVERQLGSEIDMILDGGDCTVGVESTIVYIGADEVVLLRPGGVAVEDIEDLLKEKVRTSEKQSMPEAPGQLPFHYSPLTPVKIFDSIDEVDLNNESLAFLLFSGNNEYSQKLSERVMNLSLRGDLGEAAVNLFSYLHQLDNLKLNRIYAQSVPSEGLGLAIMDRLNKAAKKTE